MPSKTEVQISSIPQEDLRVIGMLNHMADVAKDTIHDGLQTLFAMSQFLFATGQTEVPPSDRWQGSANFKRDGYMHHVEHRHAREGKRSKKACEFFVWEKVKGGFFERIEVVADLRTGNPNTETRFKSERFTEKENGEGGDYDRQEWRAIAAQSVRQSTDAVEAVELFLKSL